MYHFVLGGARSGKSRYGESLAENTGLPVVYVATAKAWDEEMKDRISRHQQDRPSHWTTVEEPLHLADVIRRHRNEEACILIDCLTLWMMSVLDDGDIESYVSELLSALQDTQGPIVLVSNEISLGVVPMGELSRRYVDELGRLHQQIAAQAKNVTLMVAGLAHPIKQPVVS